MTGQEPSSYKKPQSRTFRYPIQNLRNVVDGGLASVVEFLAAADLAAVGADVLEGVGEVSAGDAAFSIRLRALDEDTAVTGVDTSVLSTVLILVIVPASCQDRRGHELTQLRSSHADRSGGKHPRNPC